MFDKVLIANRGAIAVRIERTLKKMGIRSVAVYTIADQDSIHVDNADEAVLIGEGAPKESYLDTGLILKTALKTGAQAIHPGYGFLSENAGFARDCEKNGIVFIGPTPSQIEMFGLKHTAREMAQRALVPMLPGTGLLGGLEEALPEAAAIGYPVMLKSTAGGGGIGMRICRTKEELVGAFDSVKRLASTNFKDGGVFLEKYISRARHIEVQIFGNSYGEVIALGERDCSVQRRNQKVIEECPAPGLTDAIRAKMHSAAVSIASQAGYRSAGTVEFLYDTLTGEFYFLEVNTRLQVEHGVTEETYGVDLVEWMVLEAAGELKNLRCKAGKPSGHSIQARVYAEDCHNGFSPSAGLIDRIVFPDEVRVETWIRDNSTTTTLYDPMLAKIIVHGATREAAVEKLKKALAKTGIYGVTNNIPYLRKFLDKSEFSKAELDTHMLDGFNPAYGGIEVLDGGIQTTVQDYPGRTGYWHVGVPPCGPMDSFSFRIGNLLLGNAVGTPGLEMTLKGGCYSFRGDICFCITGADMKAELDGEPVPMYRPLLARAGSVLKFSETIEGMRAYLLVRGGFDIPKYLNSSSTFTLGGFGGFAGRALRPGDVLLLNECSYAVPEAGLEPEFKPGMAKEWEIGVIPGPHCTEEFLKDGYLKSLTKVSWEVHFNSSRTGVRLIGPAPEWSRKDGGEAGLHPSNLHDTAYAIGSLDMTGDMPILLGPDGPSLGGFVCPVTTAAAELWKIGQLKPGDSVRFKLLTLEQGEALLKAQEKFLQEVSKGKKSGLILPALPETSNELASDYPVLYSQSNPEQVSMRVLNAGDENLLVEYGEMELDIRLRFKAHILMEAIRESGIIPVIDLTPGIRSVQVHIDRTKISLREACDKLVELEGSLPPLESVSVPSRIVHLPLSWDDPATRLAIDRYHQNVRKDAPWCPSNLEFIRRINGLDSTDDVYSAVFEATYLVLGLGDVYLGAPVATPVDPRHRLVTTKYNPARTWTPENAVGIGGAYLCVYGMEGPGGYQFVGRTVQMWNRLRSTASFKEGKPWLLEFFDQIRFYPVGAQELLKLREDFIRGRFDIDIEKTTFNLGEYLSFLENIKESAAAFKKKQQAAFMAERERWKALGLAEFVSENAEPELRMIEELPPDTEPVKSHIPGSVWKVMAEPGQRVKKGDTLIIIESMKMEFAQCAHCEGTVGAVFVKPGDVVNRGQVLLGIAR